MTQEEFNKIAETMTLMEMIGIMYEFVDDSMNTLTHAASNGKLDVARNVLSSIEAWQTTHRNMQFALELRLLKEAELAK